MIAILCLGISKILNTLVFIVTHKDICSKIPNMGIIGLSTLSIDKIMEALLQKYRKNQAIKRYLTDRYGDKKICLFSVFFQRKIDLLK